MALAHAPGDQLRVLRAEVQHQHQLVGGAGSVQLGPARAVVCQYRLVLMLRG